MYNICIVVGSSNNQLLCSVEWPAIYKKYLKCCSFLKNVSMSCYFMPIHVYILFLV